MATVFAVNGSTIGRTGAHLILNGLSLSVDDPERLSWTELRLPAGTGSWSAGDMISATIDGTLRFHGQTVSAQSTAIGGGCINVSYTALGLRYLCNEIFFTAADLTGYKAWNLPQTDTYYSQGSSGKTVGDILEEALDLHQTQLTALGFGTPAYDPAELAALDVVPREPIVFSGRLLDNCADLVCQWCPKYSCYPDASDGLIHFRNTLTQSTITLTLDTDPVILESLSKTHGECYTRVVIRGGADVQGAYLSLAEGTLEARWSAPDQAAWTIDDFWMPKNGASAGDITTMSSTVLTVTADDAAEAWGTTTYWSDLGGIVWAFDPTAAGITFQEERYVVANSVKAAGASGTITVGTAYNNSGYTRYQVRGNFADISLVWRALDIVPDWVAEHLVPIFPHSMPWSPSGGALVNVTGPVGVVCWSNSHSPPFLEFPWPFELVLPDGTDRGYILCREPMVKAYSTQAALAAGGGAVLAPDDVKVLVPYSIGALEATAPASGFEGTAYTVDNVERTLYREYPDWLDRRDSANMLLLAQELLDSVKDTVYEGSITYEGKLSSALTLGKSLNIAAATVTTGWESLAAPIRSVELEYQDSSAIWLTRIRFSTRRRAFAGDRLFAPVSWGSGAQIAEGHTLGLTGARMGLTGVNQGADPLGAPGVALPASQDTGGYSPEGPGENTYGPSKGGGGRPGTRPRGERQAAGMASTFAEGLDMYDEGAFDTPDVDARREKAASHGPLGEARNAPANEAPAVGEIGEGLAAELITPQMRRRARARSDGQGEDSR